MQEKAGRPEEVIYQICRVCGESKPLNEFYRKQDAKLGRQTICKECDIARVKQYYLEHKKQKAEYIREYYLKHKKQVLECCKKYSIGHKKQIVEQKRKYNIDNRVRISEYKRKCRLTNKKEIAEQRREYYLRHKKQIAEYMRKYTQTDRGRSLGRHRNQHRRARKRDAEGDGVTPEEFERIVKNQHNKCNMCGRRFCKSRPATMDHVVPLSKNGAHSSDNIQALCRSCNSSKNARVNPNCILSYPLKIS